MARDIPRPLYDQVFELVTSIAQPDAHPLDNVDEASATQALTKLRDLYETQCDAGASDPFLTEALADFVEDDHEAISLYRRSLDEAAQFPGEPTHTKRIGLARRLCNVGLNSEASRELEAARREAFAARDSTVMAELDGLVKKLAGQ
jgi:hypothetical protein